MDLRIATVALLVTAVSLAGCAGSESGDRVIIETDFGEIVIELETEKAPITVANFVRYVDEGFYNNTLFHRISEGFMIQGGGMDTDGQFKQPPYRPIKNEAATSGLKNVKYTITMARTTQPDSATTQFFINHADNTFLDPGANGAGYAVFGRVIQGKDVVDAIASVPVQVYKAGTHCQQDQGASSCPIDDVVIRSIRRAPGFDGLRLGPAHITADLITPGEWTITNTSDSILAWAGNDGGKDADIAWSLTGSDGAPLPEGWTVTFESPTATVGARDKYTDHVTTMVRIQVPAGTQATFAAVLHTGPSDTPVTLHVGPTDQRVAVEGDAVTVHYAGRCTDTDKDFDSGDFPLTLGQGHAIKGFDLGIVGLALDEETTLVIPAALAYGKGGPCGDTETGSLTFDISIASFDG